MSSLPTTPDDEPSPSPQPSAAGVHGWRPRSARWVGWRLRALILAALIGCVTLFLLLRVLALQPVLDADLVVGDGNAVLLVLPDEVVTIQGLRTISGAIEPVDALLLEASMRWMPDPHQARRLQAQQATLAAALATGQVQLIRGDGLAQSVGVRARGAAGLGWAFWLYAAAALLVYLLAMVVFFARPDGRHALYAVMALSQVGQLALMAAGAVRIPGWSDGFAAWDLRLRVGFDLVAAAALVHLASFTPRRLPLAWAQALAAWALAAVAFWGLLREPFEPTWGWIQALLALALVAAVAQLASAQRQRPHPLTGQLLRCCVAALVTLLALTILVAFVQVPPAAARGARAAASVVWALFVASLMLLTPLLARTQHLLREFALVAGVATVATALDLLFAVAFSLSNFASLTLALFLAVAAYAAARQWLVARLMASERITTEHMFEQLYRVAREVQTQPDQAVAQLVRLLRELFDPLHVQLSRQRGHRTRVTDRGARMVVPIPTVRGTPHGALVLGLAARGRRLFTAEDARLVDRIVELVARAVEYDQAVERGRTEERVRIAQDLHDDIGARLLTLMYQAPTPAMEDYLRHTLKDLKTLTRGLAAPSHRLSHAVAEWKADLSQRLGAADCELGWSFTFDDDFELTVVQWSALTRILRELVSNTIAHARATRVEVEAAIQGERLTLVVRDNGCGGDPAAWVHGLGLGGVRKRVKQLNGEVTWQARAPAGIVCSVSAPDFAPPPPRPLA